MAVSAAVRWTIDNWPSPAGSNELRDEANSIRTYGDNKEGFTAKSQVRKLQQALDYFEEGLRADGDADSIKTFEEWDVVSIAKIKIDADGNIVEASTSYEMQLTKFYGSLRSLNTKGLVRLVAHEFRHLSTANHLLNDSKSFLGSNWADRPVEDDAMIWADNFMSRNNKTMFKQ